jgi:predicted N-acetyltransferase YhbS
MAVLPEYQRQRIGGELIRCEWEVPDEAFMILVLDVSEMQGISGVAKYRPEFSE